MKCQTLVSVGKIKKNITNLLSAEFAQRLLKVNPFVCKHILLCIDKGIGHKL